MTGTNRDRPGLRQALAAVRSIRDARDLVDELTEAGVKLQIGFSVHDPSGPVRRRLFNVLAMVAEFEADLIRSRKREGMAVARDGPSSPQSREVNRNADKVDGKRREMLTTTIRASKRAAGIAIVVYQDRRLSPPPTGCACRGLVSTFQILEPGSCALVRHACPCASIWVRAYSAPAAIRIRSAACSSASVTS